MAEAVAELALAHVVITSVDRDDLADGGAEHFARDHPRHPRAHAGDHDRGAHPGFPAQGRRGIETVVRAGPDIYNHNLETVPALYLKIRPGARYFASLRLLQRVKEIAPTMFTKSGIMVGLGEEREEVLQVMDDLRTADVDFLTVGQYLQPTRKHAEVKRFVPPEEFKALERTALAQRLPAGLGEPADALLLPRRRGLRAAQGGAARGGGADVAHAPRPRHRHLWRRQEHLRAASWRRRRDCR